MKKKLFAVAAIGAIALAGLASAAPANALACGTPALLINGPSDSGAFQLAWMSPAGTALETVPMAGAEQGYGDIALSSDAQTVYGVQNGSANDDVIDLVDAATGNVTGTLTITGVAAGVGSWVGAALRPDGKLIIGSNTSEKVFTVDTATGASAEFFDFTSLPTIVGGWTTGDFVTLDNGDEIALATLDAGGADPIFALVRIFPAGSGIIIGTVNEAWGAGRVDANLMLAGADGVVRSIALADLPSVSDTGALTEAVVVDTGFAEALWGAAGTQDSGTQVCATKLPDTGISSGTALTVGLIAAGLGLAGAASTVIARRKRA
jgi:hypothetical protein